MDRDIIRDRLVGILKGYTRRGKVWQGATDEAHIIADLQINSARVVDILLEVEDAFGIEIDNSSIGSILTINDLIDKVCTELKI